MATRNASAEWQGNLQEGDGKMALGSGAWEGPFTFKSRFEEGQGTNPEELIGAAEAGCFTMQLAHNLSEAGHTVESVQTQAKVHIRNIMKKLKATNRTEVAYKLNDLFPYGAAN